MNMMLTGGLLAAATLVAVAQTTPPTPPGSEPTALPGSTISERSAREIAFAAGLVHIEGMLLVDGHWEVAGRARGGEELSIDIDARDGRVVGDVQGQIR